MQRREVKETKISWMNEVCDKVKARQDIDIELNPSQETLLPLYHKEDTINDIDTNIFVDSEMGRKLLT